MAVEADLDGPGSLTRALTGADALLVVTFDPLRDAHDAHLLAAARRSGVRHVVKLSALAVTDPRAQDAITRWQRGCEERVRASGTSWTLLRPRAFMSNCLGWTGTVRDSGLVRTLHGGSLNSCVDPWDVAAAAARALTSARCAGRSEDRQARGGKSAVHGGVREAIGRDPGTFRAWARRHASSFGPAAAEGAAGSSAGAAATPST
ncbi:NAD(P)H-binding protein [Streptomyces sp. NPDC002644]